MHAHFQAIGDIGAGVGVMLAWVNVLPTALATVVTILGGVWYALMILDWFAKRKCDPCKTKDD